jgi:hypothetical protein
MLAGVDRPPDRAGHRDLARTLGPANSGHRRGEQVDHLIGDLVDVRRSGIRGHG